MPGCERLADSSSARCGMDLFLFAAKSGFYGIGPRGRKVGPACVRYGWRRRWAVEDVRRWPVCLIAGPCSRGAKLEVDPSAERASDIDERIEGEFGNAPAHEVVDPALAKAAPLRRLCLRPLRRRDQGLKVTQQFTTQRELGRLRGCIGQCIPDIGNLRCRVISA